VGLPIVRALAARDAGPDPEIVSMAYLIAALSGVIGARLVFVLANRELLAEPVRRWFNLTEGGVTAYGGFLAGLLGASIYLGAKRQSLLGAADAAAPALVLGTVFSRFGCYLYGCDFGSLLDARAPSWLKQLGSFPHWDQEKIPLQGSPAFLHHVSAYGLSPDAKFSLPVHPTQLYEALAGCILFGFALLAWRKRRFRGQVMAKLAIAYGGWRFAIEYLRDDSERVLHFGFSTAQLIWLAVVPISLVIYTALSSASRRDDAV
jgi:phosphatidylglycerol:prolipoprotein diacylglycerol transferase